MANPSDPRARRCCTTLTFSNVTSSETARQALLLQDSTAVGPNFTIAGINVCRTGGTAGSVVTTLRVWDAAAAGVNIYQNTYTLAANNDSAGSLGLGIPLNSDSFSALNLSLQNDTGTDQDYEVTVYIESIRSV